MMMMMNGIEPLSVIEGMKLQGYYYKKVTNIAIQYDERSLITFISFY